MAVLRVLIIWCDASFQTPTSHEAMQDQINATMAPRETRAPDPIDQDIFAEGREELSLNKVPLIVVKTIDEAESAIHNHPEEKIFVICSGLVGRYLVPRFQKKYPRLHNFYVYAHNLLFHTDWANDYMKCLRMFDFPTNLLVRLERDISEYFIERGQSFLSLDTPGEALTYFEHAEKIELAANRSEKLKNIGSDKGTYGYEPDFRERLDLLQGDHGLIAKAKAEMHRLGVPFEATS